jgi:hypothetical protein
VQLGKVLWNLSFGKDCPIEPGGLAWQIVVPVADIDPPTRAYRPSTTRSYGEASKIKYLDLKKVQTRETNTCCHQLNKIIRNSTGCISIQQHINLNAAFNA